ncbi:MAG: sugar ABC transporter substrate-binding protein [Lachnospiraceae bacterium]|nr:sugar ABC transporter substrate-binding protein [Lachnospiraceae bacterium]
MKKRLAMLVTLVMTVGLLVACGGGGTNEDPPATNDTTEETPVAGDGEVFRAAFITQAMSNESQAFSWREFERLAPEFGFEMTVFAGENEPAVEFDGVLTAIANGYDAIFVNPSSIEGIVPALQQARDAGLIVGMFSSVLPEEHQEVQHFFVGSDDYMGGVQAGEFVSANFPDGANFVEVGGQAGHSAANDRHDGFRTGIADNIVELDSQFAPTGWNTHEALSIMEDFIVMYGDEIDIVWCHWDNGASGVIEALQNAGMTDVFVIGVDGNRTGYAQVRNGTQALSVGQSFTNMATESLRLARVLLEGGTVDSINYIPLDMVTIETIDNFVEPDW